MRLPRLSPTAYRRITLIALLALCGIVVTGAAVRLTGSGLGCSDWPTCEDDKLVAPLEYHALVEFVNRTITGIVSVAVILAVLGSLVRTPRRPDLTRWSLGLVAGVIAQIVWGGVTVLTHLNPVVVQGHFLLSMVLVWDAVVLHHLAGLPSDPRSGVAQTGERPPPVVRGLATAIPLVGLVVLTAGTIVTATGPHGGDEEARRLALSISDVARLHGATALLFLGLIVALRVVCARQRVTGRLTVWTEVLLAAVVLQIGVGYVQYFTSVPPLLVGAHVAAATTIWVVAVKVALTARSPAPGPTPVPGDQALVAA
jgi:cytochrome c oxidase assembly protein subunit 15